MVNVVGIEEKHGFVYTVDDTTGAEKVRKYDDEGNKVLEFSVSATPKTITVDDAGFIFVGYATKYEKYDDEGNKIATVTVS
jgi:hypothetical protein